MGLNGLNINKELKNGIVVSAIGKYSNFIVQFLVLAILSRILTPSEYGIVSIITVFLIFFQMIMDLGIGPAIIQNKKLENHQINSIFSFTILLSIILSIIFALFSKPIAIFYDNDQLVYVCLGMSIALLTSGLNMVPQSILLKEKRFLVLNFAQVSSSIISGIIGIILALNHFSYFALIISTIVKNLTIFFLIYRKTKLKVVNNIKISDLSTIYIFSRNQFLFNIINYFSRNLDKILIGKFLNIKDLSFYERAYTLSLYPNQMLTNVITPVIQPIMSDFESQNEIIKKTYLNISKLFAFIGMPLSIFLFFSSEELVYVFFGSQWLGSVGTLQVLSLTVWIQMILSSSGVFFQSANRTELLLLSGIFSTILNVVGILTGVWLGKIEYVALMLLFSFLLNFIQCNYLLMTKVFSSKQIEFYKNLFHPIIISIMVYVSLYIIDILLSNYTMIILLIIKGLISLFIYILGMKITGNIKLLYNIIRK